MIGVRLHADLLVPLDKNIQRTDKDETRPEAIRRILREWLIEKGHL